MAYELSIIFSLYAERTNLWVDRVSSVGRPAGRPYNPFVGATLAVAIAKIVTLR
jgi:hypothetical protein